MKFYYILNVTRDDGKIFCVAREPTTADDWKRSFICVYHDLFNFHRRLVIHYEVLRIGSDIAAKSRRFIFFHIQIFF